MEQKKQIWKLEPQQLYQQMSVSSKGLSSHQARKRMEQYGPNERERKRALPTSSLNSSPIFWC